jgi:hypothetical protein
LVGAWRKPLALSRDSSSARTRRGRRRAAQGWSAGAVNPQAMMVHDRLGDDLAAGARRYNAHIA